MRDRRPRAGVGPHDYVGPAESESPGCDRPRQRRTRTVAPTASADATSATIRPLNSDQPLTWTGGPTRSPREWRGSGAGSVNSARCPGRPAPLREPVSPARSRSGRVGPRAGVLRLGLAVPDAPGMSSQYWSTALAERPAHGPPTGLLQATSAAVSMNASTDSPQSSRWRRSASGNTAGEW